MNLKNIEAMCNSFSPGVAQQESLGSFLTRGKIHVLQARYDFTVLAGAIGSVNLKDAVHGGDAKLPSGAIIKKVLINSITDPTSGGAATVALSAQSAGDLKAATAIASITGLVDGVPAGTGATMIKLTADRTLTATIATAALTAGKVDVLVEYYMPAV